MQTTANYGLKKPDGDDTVAIGDLNFNADRLDDLVKGLRDDVDDVEQDVQGGLGAVDGKIATAKTEAIAASKPKVLFVTIPVSGWQSTVYTFAAAGTAATDTAFVYPAAPGGAEAFGRADIWGTTAAGSITLQCHGTVPTAALDVCIVMMKGG
jgi:hypothetical protein